MRTLLKGAVNVGLEVVGGVLRLLWQVLRAAVPVVVTMVPMMAGVVFVNLFLAGAVSVAQVDTLGQWGTAFFIGAICWEFLRRRLWSR